MALRRVALVFLLIITSFTSRAQFGTLDTSFNHTGKLITTPIGGMVSGSVTYALPDNKILEAGICMVNVFNYYKRPAVVKHLADGSLDSSFGAAGTTIIDALGATTWVSYINMAVQPDGKILIITDLGNARLDSNGQLDPTFGNAGVVMQDQYGGVYNPHIGIALLNNGYFITSYGNHSVSSTVEFKKYKPNGSLDSSFAHNGVDSFYYPADVYDGDIVVQPDGKIIFAGGRLSTSVGWNARMMLMRLRPNGSLDSTFATNGTYLDANYSCGHLEMGGTAVALQSDGKILVGCSSASLSTGFTSFTTLRFLSGGVLDTAYGFQGSCLIMPKPRSSSHLIGMHLQPDGKLLACGNTDSGSTGYYAIIRVTGSGKPDSSFGGTAYVADTFSHNWLTNNHANPGTIVGDQGVSVTISPNGHVIATSMAIETASKGFQLCAYDSGGHMLPAFGSFGKKTTAVGRAYDYFPTVTLVLPNGKVLVSLQNGVIAQRNADGTVDSTFGSDGMVDTEFVLSRSGTYIFPIVAGFARSPSGRIYVALNGIYDTVIVVRLNPNGAIDTTYGNRGFSQSQLLNCNSICLQRDGRLLLYGIKYLVPTDSIQVLRLRTTGTIDQSFGQRGYISYDFSAFGTSYNYEGNIIQLRNSKILVCTRTEFINFGLEYMGFARFNADGSPDLSFGPRGLQAINPLHSVNYYGGSYYSPIVAEDSLQRLVVTFRTEQEQQYLFRFDSSLRKDSSFAGFSYTLCPLLLSSSIYYFGTNPASLIVQPDNKVLLGIYIITNPLYRNIGDSMRFAILRYNANGSPDATFGSNGKVLTQMSPNGSNIGTMALGYDGRLLAAGWAQMGYNKGLAIARYHLGIPAIDTPLNHGDTLDYAKLGIQHLVGHEGPVFYPNPLKESGTLSYDLLASSDVTIRILDQVGRQVARLRYAVQAPGHYTREVEFPAQTAPGFYFIVFETADEHKTIKVLKQ